ncbi:MAG: hypothetical protein H7326_04615, partial [Bdellovibrionaceae bacterium]|nr:hypothetical protein [Pseudobdellovibrionaceae bacterium]
MVQVSEATSLPISADADFLRIAVLLKKSQIGTYSQLNFFEAQISNAKLKVSAQKMLVELYQAFAKDFDGESIRNATRITELTQRRDALMLAMQTATPDPMVNAEYMEVAYEVAIR